MAVARSCSSNLACCFDDETLSNQGSSLSDFLRSLDNDFQYFLCNVQDSYPNSQVIIEGLNEEYDGYTTSIMARFGSLTVPEAFSLQAYDEMLNSTKNTGSTLLVANLTHAYFPSNGRGGGRRGRGANHFHRGGRNYWQHNRTICQICGRGGHATSNCYYRYDQQFTDAPNSKNPSTQIPYSNSTPPPPPSSFH
ncbi:hypothetical protein PIB30_039459 [Stylosanthes scabra]|uniref:CCHC-type domain-containing protein n=1 Tax=Stylosanthes scabra TaxID=79078 RepID=A0ABU6VCX1_9FABA|nr:hypothetical protein [Stylosanthes scabra]